ncbi:Putative uncharacterized protein [Taphrina deformans PYCC 5710]|uniref:HhH-GPD domain-containing protein n=1 Tax=Taphrina deformans (strain PYCC 5710 / ATCC 11124 / CBS 356.35 / IMI 108563 / JCM 9778 / NBRC 8474) TaxID=1097556 RepID=R4XH28_TAPDE|nr:Putative uncharacterized protein [Taphrina deformans PYCC 5710]|eukprot:CCG82681.1 Putative uncharacterized protein [Taphrina deformans PYCC 5710]
MSRRSSRNITAVLKQTKAPNAAITKKIKKEPPNIAIKSELVEEVRGSRTSTTIVKEEEIKVDPLVSPVLQDAVNHLCSVDPRFHSLFQRYIPKPWTQEGLAEPKNHFRSLILGVISQQVSGAAARSIGRKFVMLFHGPESISATINVDIDPEVEDGPEARIKQEPVEQPVPLSTSAPASAAPANDTLIMDFFPSVEQVANADVMYLKSAGLSLRKAEYVQGIAKAFQNGEVSDEFFSTANNETIKTKLVSLRGLGPWSVEMFMMFSLKHWDILSPGDIGIQRGMSYFVGKDPRNKSTHNKNKAQKYMSEAEMKAATESWKPFRYASAKRAHMEPLDD